MTVTARKSVAVLLIALLAIISCVGEGLHWIPGCGHGLAVGDTVILLGISPPDVHRPDDGRTRVGRPEGKPLSVYGEDQCAICSAVGRSCTTVDAPPALLVLQLVGQLTPTVDRHAPATPASSFHARAPPLA